ncbi:MAG: hypothetical protein GX591_12095 [Planctomycetes bacterium]|nr:hypothetical protein [Planctomycetota bacterium]
MHTFLVVDAATGRPLADVAVRVRWYAGAGRYLTPTDGRTDADGRCDIPLPDEPIEGYVAFFKKPGYVVHHLRGAPPMAERVELTAGRPVGGIVRNGEGEPLAGVEIALHGRGVRDVWAKTGPDGRWRSEFTPADLGEDFRVLLQHPDYISDDWTGGAIPMPFYPTPPAAKLQALEGEWVMPRGTVVAGSVRGPDGKPVAGADVSVRDDWQRFGAVTTDGQGRFRMGNARPGSFSLLVTAEGLAPHEQTVDTAAAVAPIEVRLSAGAVLRGRVMDVRGRPIAGAYVGVDQWRGRDLLDWRAATDAEGRFAWNAAPHDGVTLRAGQQGFMGRRATLMPSQEEQLIVLPDVLVVGGSVADAETGEPIKAFRAIAGIAWDGGNTSWDQRRSRDCVAGTYELHFDIPYPGHLVRIEAPGYKPAVSRTIADDEGRVTIDFRLEPGRGPSGVLLGLDGRPLAGVQVFLCTARRGPYFQNGRMTNEDAVAAATDAEGRFALAVVDEPFALVAATAEGYVEAAGETLSADGTLRLQPWGRIEGRVLRGTRPLADAEIAAHAFARSGRQVRANHTLRARADAEGRFVIDRVPPGELQVSRSQAIDAGRRSFYAQTTFVEVEAGRTTTVTLGGVGRPVIGRIALPEGLSINNVSIMTESKVPKPPWPSDWERMDLQQQRAWYAQWMETDEGKAYRAAIREEAEHRRYYNAGITADGSFRAEDVVEGAYTLNATLLRGSPETWRHENVAGNVRHSFVVGPVPGGVSDEPLDLGSLPVTLIDAAAATGTGAPASAPVATAPAPPGGRVGRPLADLKALGLPAAAELAAGRRIVLCVFDAAQRPSRHAATVLAGQADDLAAKGAVLVLVHVGPAEQAALWRGGQESPPPCGQVGGGDQAAAWTTPRLPWIIVTDAGHVVRSEGVELAELEARLAE